MDDLFELDMQDDARTERNENKEFFEANREQFSPHNYKAFADYAKSKGLFMTESDVQSLWLSEED